MARQLFGVVSSDKGDKTIVVTVTTRKTHPLYKKQYSVTTKFMAHDETNQAHVGDKVQLVETRPISARKHFKLDKIVETARIMHVEAEPVKEAKAKVEEPVAAAKPKAKTAAKTEEDK